MSTSSAAAAPSEEKSPAKNPTLAVAFLGILAGIQLIDPAVANIAIVEASKSLGMTGSVVALAASISTLALAATVLPMGMMADRLGRRKILGAALILAIAGDVIVAISPVTAGYLAGRAVAGIGVGATLAAAFAYVRYVARPGKVAAALGLWNLVMVIFFIAGSLVGGQLAGIDWRIAMLLVPAIALVSLLLVPIILPAMPKVSGARPDYLGMLVIALAMVFFLYGVAQASGGIRNPAFLIPTAIGIVLFGLYYVVERKVANPIFPPALFASGVFAAAAVSGIAWNFAQATVQLQTSNFWQYVQGFTPGQVALGQTAMMISFGGAGVLAGRLMRPGMRSLTLMGMGFVGLAGGLLLLAFVVKDTPYWVMAIMLFIFGFGLAFVSVPQSALFVAEAPKSSFGPVTSFRTTVGQLGYAMGFAVSAALVGAFGTRNLIGRLEEAGVQPSQLGKALDDVRLFMRTGKDSSGELAKESVADLGAAYSAGFNWAVGISGIAVGLLGAITILLLIIGMKQDKDHKA
ncbi:MAG: MFS transporter [Candidatus Nanopelagicales bacterium]|nr:MFS transporter [Candidatus Nanopelagicales bacterium]